MAHVNENYLKLPGNYLFATIAKKVEAYSKAHPEANIIRLGIGDVTRPLAPAIIDAMHKAVDEMGKAETFRGYGPEQGYDFLRQAIIDGDYKTRGIDLDLDEVFVGDGAKTDVACIQEIFGDDLKFAVADPVYPVYLDSNVMFGHTGEWNAEKGIYDGVVYLPCTPENGFKAEPPKEKVDIVYLCNPSNPTGTAMSKEELTNWVKAAKENNFIIIYDSAYETYITEPDVPHSIFEIEGAKEVAIELRSYSKCAGFTPMSSSPMPASLTRKTARLSNSIPCGTAVSAPSSTARRTSSSAQLKLTTARKARNSAWLTSNTTWKTPTSSATA